MKKTLLIYCSLLLFVSTVFAQSFTNINAGLTGLHWSDVAWGDYDADGDLDVIITGSNSGNSATTKIYKNEGNDTFTELTGISIPGTLVGDVAWGDYDNDGDLDILIQGYTDASQITSLYKNNDNDTFADSGVNLIALVDGSVSFIDYNNDGYLDILNAGFDGNAYQAYVHKNNGDGSFTQTDITLPGVIKSSYEWADYDADGDMDIFITGLDGVGNLISKLFQNNGDETFSETTNTFTGAWLGDAAWGDYDNDGNLDLLLSGFYNPGRITNIYRNNGDGTFTEQTDTGLTGVSHSSSIWGDYDSDGDLDVFIGGTYEGTGVWIRVTDVFVNNGDNTFTAANLPFTIDAYWGESAWGDYDADGDLDLICCGFDDVGGSNTIIYRNDSTTPNSIPDTPQNLIEEIIGSRVTMEWDAAIDNETPAEGLSYNAYIRNDTGEVIWNSMSIADTGMKLIPSLGNASQNTGWTINDLADGIYLWSVQSVDNNFAGSLFADENTFTVGTIGTNENEIIQPGFNFYNYPNPFNPTTNINYNVYGEDVQTELIVYNIKGQKVKRLVSEKLSTGKYTIVWNGVDEQGSKVSSGVYFYKMKAGKFQETKKMILMK